MSGAFPGGEGRGSFPGGRDPGGRTAGGFPGGSFPGGSFPGGQFPSDLFGAFEGLRSRFEKRVGPRMGRGDVRAAVLVLLAERPMHGYQLIRAIEERSAGAWKPSPGSVYPTLQLLADEGFVDAEEAAGRKTYTLTESGRAAAEEVDADELWGSSGADEAHRIGELPKAAARLAQAAMTVARDGSPAQVDQAVQALDEARRRMFAILADG